MYVTEVNFFISLYIPKFTSINPMYQNSASVHIYIKIDISKYISLMLIYIKYIYFSWFSFRFHTTGRDEIDVIGTAHLVPVARAHEAED